MANWLTGKVKAIKWWNERLFSLIVNAPITSFKAGQFTKLALNIGDKRIARAYSFVNAPNNQDLEFYLIKVDEGSLTIPLAKLKIGDEVQIASDASGFFTIDEVPSAQQLWLLSTGTGIGPYLSILQENQVWKKYEKIILVHAARKQEDLSYQNLITNLCEQYSQLTYVSVVSREQNPTGLVGRVPNLIETGELFEFCALTPTKSTSQFMVCGNPDMVKDTSTLLHQLGYERNRRRAPGHVTVEQYW